MAVGESRAPELLEPLHPGYRCGLRVRSNRVLARRLELVMNLVEGKTMSETDALAHPPGTRAVPTTPPHSIRSAQELHEALTAGEPRRRLGALQAIISRPDAARRLGVHAGLDVIALLLQQETRMRGCLEWLSWVGALAAFRDPRVSAFFIELLRTAEQPDILFAAARYLSSEPSAQLYPSLSPLLLQHTCVPRARAVAQVLAGCAVLSPAERLRVALLAPAGGSAAPQLDQTTADCWLTELQGPYRLAAQTGLQAQGESAFAALCGLWERLDDDARSWLVG